MHGTQNQVATRSGVWLRINHVEAGKCDLIRVQLQKLSGCAGKKVIKSLCLIGIICSRLTQTGGKTSEMGVCFLGIGIGARKM